MLFQSMKTLLLISHSSSLTGGGEEDFLRLLKFFHGKYNLIGILPEGDRVEEYKNYVSEYLIIPDHMFPFTEFSLKKYASFFLLAFPKIKLIKSFLSDKKIDLAYIHSSVSLYEAYTMASLNIPFIISIREFINPVYIRQKIYNFYLNSAKKIIIISKLLEKEFVKLNRDIDKVELIYLAIEPIKVKELMGNNEDTILNIGNISPQKGQHKIIEAMSIIEDLNKKVTLKFIGKSVDENYFKYINSLIKRNNLSDKIIFTGGLSREKVLSEISKAYFVIISSFQEGFSLVLLEALASKKPTISTKVGVIPEVIVDNENGLLYDCHDSEMLADKIKLLLKDYELYEKISTNGFITYKERFDLNESLNKHEDLFRSVMKIY